MNTTDIMLLALDIMSTLNVQVDLSPADAGFSIMVDYNMITAKNSTQLAQKMQKAAFEYADIAGLQPEWFKVYVDRQGHIWATRVGTPQDHNWHRDTDFSYVGNYLAYTAKHAHLLYLDRKGR